ncbi:hypothetical protein ABZ626_22315 [Streptomyces longispororuber]|uniref:hypothetical protein n=1 Tax=Streptomyces longispororuber TaxID=68230 RepID=UPI0033D2BF26
MTPEPRGSLPGVFPAPMAGRPDDSPNPGQEARVPYRARSARSVASLLSAVVAVLAFVVPSSGPGAAHAVQAWAAAVPHPTHAASASASVPAGSGPDTRARDDAARAADHRAPATTAPQTQGAAPAPESGLHASGLPQTAGAHVFGPPHTAASHTAGAHARTPARSGAQHAPELPRTAGPHTPDPRPAAPQGTAPQGTAPHASAPSLPDLPHADRATVARPAPAHLPHPPWPGTTAVGRAPYRSAGGPAVAAGPAPLTRQDIAAGPRPRGPPPRWSNDTVMDAA